MMKNGTSLNLTPFIRYMFFLKIVILHVFLMPDGTDKSGDFDIERITGPAQDSIGWLPYLQKASLCSQAVGSFPFQQVLDVLGQ